MSLESTEPTSSLIILPGSAEFNETPTPGGASIFVGDLTNRIISLDLTRAKAWQCGGFAVNFNCPVAVVSPKASHERIRQALLEGILIDITDQPNAGMTLKGTSTSATKIEDAGLHKVYLTVDASGGVAVMIPKDDAEQEKCEEVLANGGVVVPDNPEIKEQSAASKSRVGQGNVSSVMDGFTSRFKG